MLPAGAAPFDLWDELGAADNTPAALSEMPLLAQNTAQVRALHVSIVHWTAEGRPGWVAVLNTKGFGGPKEQTRPRCHQYLDSLTNMAVAKRQLVISSDWAGAVVREGGEHMSEEQQNFPLEKKRGGVIPYLRPNSTELYSSPAKLCRIN